MKDIEKRVKKEKAFDRNSYAVSDGMFKVLWYGCIALAFSSLIEPFVIGYGHMTAYLVMLAAALVIFAGGVLLSIRKKSEIVPYSRQDGFSFIGLHNLTKENLGGKTNDVLSRTEEVECIHSLLENIIFPQNDIKQAICVTGKSGCGKSTILAFFQQKFEDEYEIHNFSGNYNSIKATLQQQFETVHVDQKIKELSSEGKKIVFIFDQFERYFYLSAERQLDIRNFISSLCMKNTAIIASMREEFLAEFLREFDLNDIKSNYKLNSEVEHKGLLRRLIGYIKDSDNYTVINGSRRRITLSKWQNDHIKNPDYLHISDPDGKRSNVEKTDATIFYCENQNSSQISVGGKESSSPMILVKCEEKFGEELGRKLYSIYCNKPLIEQQIIMHMAEFDAAFRDNSETAAEFCKTDTHEIIKRYFDIQLASTNDYFNASRVMYMLSSSRLHQISMKTDEIIAGLCANQFSPKGKRNLETVIAKLEELQLIRKNSSNSNKEYEIAHDYIATAFLNYSRANMDRNVKAGLDIFLADYIDEFEKNLNMKKAELDRGITVTPTNSKPFYEEHYSRNSIKYYKIMTVVAIVAVLVIDVVYRFIYNPWIDGNIPNPMGDLFPLFIPIHIVISILYFYQIFDKVYKYYNGKNKTFLKLEYIGFALVGIASECLYPHFIISDSVGLIAIGATACLILGKEYREASRAALWGYGIKTVVVGIVFAFAHVLFYLSQGQLPTYLVMFEMLAQLMIVGYAHFSHMSKEYLYGRCMDVSGKTVK